ncbi:hypothetical protein [Paenirhodobacter sp. CAU 1674]|uniref:hypothetical protein n=1 Tax=Paenirhodobacter sp. CAU 1674 TaxID=3032596 RepID=UPI0023D9BF3E|nr:hypothetical protein [Paenirhodobacter sp. CAU 1674]MDF2141465.1 hypothetical protein [Paenirhodobacter sp. CAU 1674]
MVKVLQFPQKADPAKALEESLAYYTPLAPAPLKPEAGSSLSALELMYAYYNAA